MRRHNPAVIPRNHRVEEALQAATSDDDLSVMQRLLDVLASPYDHERDLAGSAPRPGRAALPHVLRHVARTVAPREARITTIDVIRASWVADSLADVRAGEGVSVTRRRCLVVSAALAMVLGRIEVASAQVPRHHLGVVVDLSGTAVAGAQVIVRTAGGAPLADVLTEADGTFRVTALPSGSYWLDVTARSFQGRRLRFDSDAATADPMRVVLGLAPFQSETTVTAERGTIADVERTAPIVTVRTGDDFRRRPLATIGNALEGATGVMVQQSTNGQVSPFLRGLTGYQVLNLIDGVRLNNTTFRSGPNQYLAFVDPSQAERIEAMLGPASAQFGSDAMGGAIQVLTPPAQFSTSGPG